MPPRRRHAKLTRGHWRLPSMLERWALFRLRRAAAALSYEAERVLWASGLSIHEFAALAVIVESPYLPLAALGQRIGLDRNGISRVVDALEEEGLAVRREHVTDARRRVVDVTAEGRSRLAAAEEDLAAIEAAFQSPLDEVDREELRQLLRRLEPPPRCSATSTCCARRGRRTSTTGTARTAGAPSPDG